MRLSYTALITSVFFFLLAPYVHAADPLTDRNASLVNSFQVFCFLEKAPSFDAIDAKLTAMKAPVQEDIGHKATSGYFARSKSWIIGLNSGPHQLVATEANGPKGHIEGCGISALDVNGDGFVKELVEEMHLDEPSTQNITPDGTMRVTSWENKWGDGSQIQLFDATPKEHPGIMLFYRLTTKPLP